MSIFDTDNEVNRMELNCLTVAKSHSKRSHLISCIQFPELWVLMVWDG